MPETCPRCQYEVAEEFVFCPRCAKVIWPHLRKDIPRQFKTFTLILGAPTLLGCLLGMVLGQNMSATAFGAAFGLALGVFVVFAGFILDAWR